MDICLPQNESSLYQIKHYTLSCTVFSRWEYSMMQIDSFMGYTYLCIALTAVSSGSRWDSVVSTERFYVLGCQSNTLIGQSNRDSLIEQSYSITVLFLWEIKKGKQSWKEKNGL